MSLLDRIRPELAAFTPYASARRSGFEARIRLDANECPWDLGEEGNGAAADLNRYPSPQPAELIAQLAALYDVDRARIWLGRGSDEAIDLLLRAFCRAGRDNVVALAPTFGMYRIGAQLQGAAYRTLDLHANDAFAFDAEKLLALCDDDTKLVIVCSPNNPTGTLYHDERLPWLAERLAGRALLLIDEAYIEFAGIPSAANLIDRHPNVAVLRTLSKAHALAGARVGALIADAALVDFVARIAAPYPLPTSSMRAALAVLDEAARARTQKRVVTLLVERTRVATALCALAEVDTIWPSAANFLLVRFADARATFARLLAAGILVRDFSAQPGLANCLRITLGRPDENDALIDALRAGERGSAGTSGAGS
ncbi:MAG TPA: histidinol-phosphate transaminase [Dokdonella sp.]